ncbi:MAG: bacteriohopanetetrol glucosamine biosynthesis glycosyltransferase HpnI [Rhodospirillales bacterium]|nr:bacteriohopanetetrol glucosamine biosynthesis glycosyltransferase HpnI [Rhodospirillales bacterium]
MQIALYMTLALFAASIGYLLVASYCVLKFKAKLMAPLPELAERPPATLYKPLHGREFELKENLESFFRQSYPHFQIIFGVGSETDGAVAIVRELIARYPSIDAELVIDDTANGLNPKISNLINMDKRAKHDLLIISDSDMIVEPDYMDRIVAAFQAPNTGLVTCLYKGTPAPGLASNLGAMFISQWFTPSALIPATFGEMQNCFGATMAVRRDVLVEIGGFDALVSNLADDYTLGRLVRQAGYAIALAPVVVENSVQEKSLASLVLHELRWARTIRSVEPLGFLSTFLTDAIPLSLISGILAHLAGFGGLWVALPLLLALMIRILLHISTKTTFSSKQPVSLWIIPIRDLLSFFVRLLCYTGRTVNWRDTELSVEKGGEITHLGPAVR